ncbi:MAG: L-ribulose-5-phosphate 4-epimerase [Candidatus Glassbacteria bacterium]
MLEELRQEVLEANLELRRKGLILFTWGNASGCDRQRGLVVIKPSGVPYEDLSPDKLVVVDLDGRQVEGDCNPSSDTPTHLEIYKAFPQVSGVAHSHSTYAVIWAQARRPIPAFGTTHADYFHGEVPLTRPLTPREIGRGYEVETGRVIAERFRELDPLAMPGVLVYSHGPFTWGESAARAVENMAVLEEVARMAWGTVQIDPLTPPMQQELLDKHYYRKHGDKSYYGQKKQSE